MSKEEFYKYGKSLGININDLQRLKMLATAEQTLMLGLIHDIVDKQNFEEYSQLAEIYNITHNNSLNKQD